LEAVEVLGGKQDRASVDRLGEVLRTDPFHAVRSEAAAALRQIHSDEAFAALTNALVQPDARVRVAVLRAVDGFYRDSVGDIAVEVLSREKQADVRLAAIRMLANPGAKDGSSRLVAWMGTNSFRDEITRAAFESLRRREDPSVVPALLEFLRARGPQWTTGVQSEGLATLAWLSRHQEDRSAVRVHLESRVNDLRPGVRRAALQALGELGDPQATSVLQTFAQASKQTPEQAAAASALAKVREARRSAPELGELRKEVTDLQKENRDMKREFDALKKKLDALAPPTPGTNAPAAGK
jgi:aminopeptidase N